MIRQALLIALSVLAVSPSFAQNDDESGEAAVAARIAAERAKKRTYPGGRDEQELAVQATLPQPVRAPEAQSQAATSEETAND